MHVGQIIRQERKRLKLTQVELGLKLDITDKAVSQWERGITEPDHDKIPSIARILGIPLAKLAPEFKENLPSELIELWKRFETDEARERALALWRVMTGSPA